MEPPTPPIALTKTLLTSIKVLLVKNLYHLPSTSLGLSLISSYHAGKIYSTTTRTEPIRLGTTREPGNWKSSGWKRRRQRHSGSTRVKLSLPRSGRRLWRRRLLGITRKKFGQLLASNSKARVGCVIRRKLLTQKTSGGWNSGDRLRRPEASQTSRGSTVVLGNRNRNLERTTY